MRKRNTRMQRRRIDPTACLKVLGMAAAAHSTATLTKSQQGEVSMRVHAAMKALVDGQAQEIDICDLLNCSNIGMALAMAGLGELEAATAGQDACARIGARHARTGRYIGTGEDITALNAAIEQYDAQVASEDCTESLLLAACRAVEREARKGNFVQAVPA